MMFSLSFVVGGGGGGSKSASGFGPGGPYPLADLNRGVQIRWDTETAYRSNKIISKQGKSVMLDFFTNCRDLCQ